MSDMLDTHEERGEKSMSEQPLISDELRGTLTQVFGLGFLDSIAGFEVTDESEMLAEQALPLVAIVQHLASGCIDDCEAKIAELYRESPQAVYDTFYRIGAEAAVALNIRGLHEPISLN